MPTERGSKNDLQFDPGLQCVDQTLRRRQQRECEDNATAKRIGIETGTPKFDGVEVDTGYKLLDLAWLLDEEVESPSRACVGFRNVVTGTCKTMQGDDRADMYD